MNPLYLDLMKRCLLNWIYPHADSNLVAGGPRSDQDRHEGDDWPSFAHTMIGRRRLDHLQLAAETVLQEQIHGDFMETGVWRGGASIFLRAVLQAYSVEDRRVWLADSFQGLPPPNPEKYPADTIDLSVCRELAVSLETVKDNFARYGLLDNQVVFLPGWFRDTLPTAPIESLAILRLDGDLYESTMDALTALYHKLTPGGFLIVDDYGVFEFCRQAVNDFRAANHIEDRICTIDDSGVYWRKSACSVI